MPQVVLTLPIEKLRTLKEHYRKQLKEPTPQNAYFAAKTPSCTITAYQSGKVLFQGKDPEQEAKRWGGEVGQSQTKKKTTSSHGYVPDQRLFTASHIGSDEAGTGDYFGPITVAAAYVKQEQIAELKAIGVKDSKNLSDPQITQLARIIVERKIPYSLMRLPNEKYNEWQERGFTQGKIKALLHHQALDRLLEKIAPETPEGIIVDQFAMPDVYKRHLKSEGLTLQEKVYFMTKAESYSIAVATASIIARSAFVKAMNQLEIDLGLPVPKGASKKVDEAAGSIVQHYGEEKLRQVAKVHFANTQKAKRYLK